MTKIQLRDYQKEAVMLSLNNKKQLYCMRVGCGKTVCAMFSLRALFKRKLINKALIACTKTAVNVFIEDFRDKAGIKLKAIETDKAFFDFLKSDEKIGIIKHSMFDKIGNDFVLLKRMENLVNDKNMQIGLVIDEAHKMQNTEGVTHEAYMRMQPLFENIYLYTATPYSSCLSQFYGLMCLIQPKLWKSKRDFFNNYIDEINILDPKTHRVIRKEKVRYKNLKEFRNKIKFCTYFYYPPIPLVHVEHRVKLKDYTEYDKLCQGVLKEEDLEKIKEERSGKRLDG